MKDGHTTSLVQLLRFPIGKRTLERLKRTHAVAAGILLFEMTSQVMIHHP